MGPNSIFAKTGTENFWSFFGFQMSISDIGKRTRREKETRQKLIWVLNRFSEEGRKRDGKKKLRRERERE